MKELLEFLQSGDVGWAFIVVLVIWLIKLDIPKLFDQRRSYIDKGIEDLERALTSEHLDTDFKMVLKRRLKEIIFERHVGIYTNEMKRKALIDIHNADPSRANWVVIKRAHPYIQLQEDGRIDVVIKRWHKIERFIVQAITLFVGLYGVLLFVFGLIMQLVQGQGVIQFGALALAVFALAVFFSTISWPYNAACIIKDVLAKRGDEKLFPEGKAEVNHSEHNLEQSPEVSIVPG